MSIEGLGDEDIVAILKGVRTIAMVGASASPDRPSNGVMAFLQSRGYVVHPVNPGFAGQKLVLSAIRKIRDARLWLDNLERHLPIEVDGNVSFSNIPRMVSAGAEILVAGTSSLFRRGRSLSENMHDLRRALERGNTPGQ